MGTLREEAESVLCRLAGDAASLREDQWLAIEAPVLRSGRVLCVQRTGWGKSAVYFIATALLRARGAGPTVIVSPLLALMRNQVEAAARASIRRAPSTRPTSRSGTRSRPRSPRAASTFC